MLTYMLTFLIIFGAKYLYIVIAIIALGTVIYDKAISKRSIITLSAIAFPLSFIIARIASYFILIPRPFVIENIQPLIAHVADNGFPSDHTLLSMTIASVIFVYNKKNWHIPCHTCSSRRRCQSNSSRTPPYRYSRVSNYCNSFDIHRVPYS